LNAEERKDSFKKKEVERGETNSKKSKNRKIEGKAPWARLITGRDLFTAWRGRRGKNS